MVSELHSLCVLDVSCNPRLAQEVDAGVFGELAASLAHAPSLTALRLQACGLTTGNLEALSRRFSGFLTVNVKGRYC